MHTVKFNDTYTYIQYNEEKHRDFLAGVIRQSCETGIYPMIYGYEHDGWICHFDMLWFENENPVHYLIPIDTFNEIRLEVEDEYRKKRGKLPPLFSLITRNPHKYNTAY